MGAAVEPQRLDSLRTATDLSARHAQAGYVTFILYGVYLTITAASTTDEQLLRQSAVTLPLLNVGLPILWFYVVAPLLFLPMHFNLMIELYVLSRRAYAFELELQALVPGDQNYQRGLLYPSVLTYGLVEAPYGRLVHLILRLIVFLTVAVFPLVVLIWLQLRCLPYHSHAVLQVHKSLA